MQSMEADRKRRGREKRGEGDRGEAMGGGSGERRQELSRSAKER